MAYVAGSRQSMSMCMCFKGVFIIKDQVVSEVNNHLLGKRVTVTCRCCAACWPGYA